MLNKDQKIDYYKKDINKLNNMIQILNSTEKLHGAMYSDILESINNGIVELERILNYYKSE